MDRQFVKIEKGLGPQGRIAVVRFDRGDNINALSQQAMRELRDVPREFEDDLETSVVILTGSARAFSAGFDLKDGDGRARDGLPIGERIHRQRLGPKMCKAWQDMDQVTIAAIEGHCIGGGAALVVSLDFRTCGRSAHFRIPEIELGMNMSWGSIPRMLALMGPARTKQAVILASDRIGAADALDWGLVETVVEDGQALAASMAFAERIARQPPIPVRMTKTTVNRLAHALDDLGSHMDADQNVLTGLTEDYKEGTSAFREKRKPVFDQTSDAWAVALSFPGISPKGGLSGGDDALPPPAPQPSGSGQVASAHSSTGQTLISPRTVALSIRARRSRSSSGASALRIASISRVTSVTTCARASPASRAVPVSCSGLKRGSDRRSVSASRCRLAISTSSSRFW